MISNVIDPQLATKQVETRELIRFKSEMDGLKKRLAGDGADKQQQLKKACQNFEAVFIGKLWQQMKSTVPKEGYLHSKQEDSYMAMFDREFSEKMAQAGGIGLADMIYSQLSEKLKETSKSTLSGAVEISPLEPRPIALDQAKGGIAVPTVDVGKTLEDWGGEEVSEVIGRIQGGTGLSSEDIVSGLESGFSNKQPMTDIDVKARLDALMRRLESQRIQEGLLGAGAREKAGEYGNVTDDGPDGNVGRKLAKIG